VKQVVDTNVLVRHFTGSPRDQAAAATAFLKSAAAGQLWLTDVHLSELVWVLESSIYRADRVTVAAALEAILALPAIAVADQDLLMGAIELYAERGMDWADAYLVATARRSGVDEVVSFDRFDAKISGLNMRRLEPRR
jgi:predicted nucleic-acid-binding protein